METVLAGLRECWPVVGYRILDSRYFGVAQRRRRVFFVCGPTEAGVASILALAEGGAGDLEAGGEAGAAVAGPARVGIDLARARGGIGGGQDYGANKGTLVSTDASEDGTGRGTPLVPVCPGGDTDKSYWKPADQANTLAATDLPWQGTRIAYPDASVRRLTPVECERLQGFPDGWTCLCQPLEVYAADADAAALRCICPDSPRYRALGNAVTVNVVEWLGRRLMHAR
jgi:site-specific DNA-cytosine methylase